MNDVNPCLKGNIKNDSDNRINGGIACHICNRELDYVTAFVSGSSDGSIYICFESIKQKIFVYGKYIGGKYGAINFLKYYTKEECAEKLCEKNIKEMLASLEKVEYSRFITCYRGNMDSIILTKDIINMRKEDLFNDKLKEHFKETNSEKKYYCHEHAKDNNLICSCGEELLQIGSERHRELSGMEDQKFIEKFLPEILVLQ